MTRYNTRFFRVPPLPVAFRSPILPSDRFLNKLLAYDYDLHGELIISVGKKSQLHIPKLQVIDVHHQTKNLRKICDIHPELPDGDDIGIDIYSTTPLTGAPNEFLSTTTRR